MEIRPYKIEDREACLSIFDSLGQPPALRSEFASFLDNPSAVYLALEHDGRLIGCGGVRAEAGQSVAHLEWGMIHRDLQRQGLGRYLLLYRLKEIGRVAGVQHVELKTPPASAPFFEKYAFRLAGEDSGLLTMRMKLQVCA